MQCTTHKQWTILFFEVSSLSILFTELWILFTEFFQSKKNKLVTKNKQKKSFLPQLTCLQRSCQGKEIYETQDNKDRNEFLKKVYASLYFLWISLSVKRHPSVVRGNWKPNKAQHPVVGHLRAPKEWIQGDSTAHSPGATKYLKPQGKQQ